MSDRMICGPNGQFAKRASEPICRRAVRSAAAVSAVIAVSLALVGCAETMPAPPGLTAAAGTDVVYNEEAAFSVGVVPNRAPPVRIGEEIGFALSTNTAGFGHLYLLNASGNALVLAENLLLAAGGQTAFPPPGSETAFRASPPAGVERIIFLVTRQPFQGFGGSARLPAQLPVTAGEFLAELNSATARMPAQGWAVVESRLEIVP